MLRNIDIDRLKERLVEAMPGLEAQQIDAYAERMIRETDERLEPNVDEWIRGEQLTDIWIDKYCVGFVMMVQGRGDFLSALEALNCYVSDHELGERKIWRATL